jgi:DNA-binding MarR family transcriptional regulator
LDTLIAQCISTCTFDILEADDRFGELLHRTQPELAGLNILELTHQADRTYNGAALGRLKRDNTPFSIIKRYVRPDGSAVTVRNHVSMHRMGAARPMLFATIEALDDGQAVSSDLCLMSKAQRALRERRTRAKMFDVVLGEPELNILLDLFIQEVLHRPVSVSSACIAANVAMSTALRCISKLVDEGLIVRVGDPGDQRRTFLILSASAGQQVRHYIDDL